ncbi:probable ATP-dependent RNA helicase DDX31 [Mya arenaria]|uniref:probable ATP-dependent RNA helicase DDX31 n=1 Tax=Mya arenaria TaxID=6604 RepID=UPI0022E6589E|nr:probable ATP-dependent RNA helicase DDX31 [Mya arenaria]
MEDDLDAGLSIGISTHHRRDPHDSTERRKIVGNRGQRIKARKNLKRQKERYENGTQDTSEYVVNKKPQDAEIIDNIGGKAEGTNVGKDKKTSSDKRQKESVGKKRPGDVISSLFRHNPDIPTVKSGSVHQVKEILFTSDSFQDTPLHPYMVSNLEKLGFTKMTTVQHLTIPKLVGGQDLMVKSQTGSGKTMAYAIPIIENLASVTPKLQRSDGCQVMVIVPTRELALQSYDVFVKLLKPFTWIVAGCIMGGEKRKAEKARLRKGINILVATPGRLIDHIENTESFSLTAVKWLVLDEADRLLDLGFEAKVSQIIQALDRQFRQTRQTVLLSATLTPGVERLAGMSLKNPERVSVSHGTSSNQNSKLQVKNKSASPANEQEDTSVEDESSEFAIPESLKQYFVITPCKLRLVVLLTLILSKCKRGTQTKMLVFVSTQDGVEFLYRLVTFLSREAQSDSDVEEEHTATSRHVHRLHGDMSQKDRTATFQDFCEAKAGVLLCTDVAARGLHLPSVHWVVQYSCAAGITDYVHRVGRTARAGTAGNTLLFLLPSETAFLQQLNQKNISLSEMKVGEILKGVMKLIPDLPGMAETERQAPNTVEEAATYLQNCCEMFVKNTPNITALAKTAYQSYIRAYATYPYELKPIFHLRHLHLGHVAKTFGLRAAPSDMSNIQGVDRSTLSGKRKHQGGKDDRPQAKKRRTPMSEFAGPLMVKIPKKKTGKQKQKKKTKKPVKNK